MKDLDLTIAEQMMKLMRSYGATEMEVESGDSKIKVSFNSGQSPAMPYFNAPAFQPAAAQPMSPVPQSEQKADAAPIENSAPKVINAVKSPFVGTFYRASAPDEEPFVSVGQAVKKGQTLCIVEAMKLMNEIESDRDGVVKEILIQNEQPVEFDQALFIID